MPCFSLAVTEGQMSIRTAEVRPYYFFFFALVEARALHVAINVAAWLFQSHAGVSVGADMMPKKPEIGDEDGASLKTYLDASRM